MSALGRRNRVDALHGVLLVWRPFSFSAAESCPGPEETCSCGGDIHHECDACEQYWRHHWALHDELKLQPWQPPYGNYEDTNKTGVLERYRALKAASDARKRT